MLINTNSLFKKTGPVEYLRFYVKKTQAPSDLITKCPYKELWVPSSVSSRYRIVGFNNIKYVVTPGPRVDHSDVIDKTSTLLHIP